MQIDNAMNNIVYRKCDKCRYEACDREFEYLGDGVWDERRDMEERENFKDLVLKKAKEGKIVLMTFDGPMEADLEEFIKQPTEGILYDLNRDAATVLSFIEDKKWVNDFAVGLVIAKLKEEVETLKQGSKP